MLSFNPPIKEEKNYNDLKIVEIEPTIKINLRSSKREFSTKIGKILSILPPNEANTSSGNENYNLLWLSPDEWLVYSNNINHTLDNQIELENNLFNEILIILILNINNLILLIKIIPILYIKFQYLQFNYKYIKNNLKSIQFN